MAAMRTPLPAIVPAVPLDLKDEDATRRLAAALARMCCAGDLIRLCGDLGAGKSTFARHFIHALGHAGEVPSPTYTLVQAYTDTRFALAHVDCYRLKSPAELDGLGLEQYRAYGVILAEWPDKGGDLLAAGQADFLDYHINSIENPGVLTVTLEATGETTRRAVLEGSPSWQRRFALLRRFDVDVPEDMVLNRPVTEQGRHDFLESVGVEDYTMEGQSGDWSGRSYARVTLANGDTRMLMDAPVPQEGVTAYADVAEYYRGIGLHAARIDGRDDVEGYLLTEDFGDTQLWHLVKDGAQHTDWYAAVADGLIRQCRSEPPRWARAYTPRDWWVEVVRFPNWYLPYARGKAATLEEYAQWQQLWAPLYAKLMALPTGMMMWDCQSPNLMILGDEPMLENLGWIDIQDARVGPVVQDLALLLRNIRSPRDDGREKEILDYVAMQLSVDRRALQTALEIGSLHHSCRILGGLVRLHVRDGRSAPAMAYMARLWDVARQSFACPDLRAIVDFMKPWEEPGMARLQEETAGQAA